MTCSNVDRRVFSSFMCKEMRHLRPLKINLGGVIYLRNVWTVLVDYILWAPKVVLPWKWRRWYFEIVLVYVLLQLHPWKCFVGSPESSAHLKPPLACKKHFWSYYDVGNPRGSKIVSTSWSWTHRPWTSFWQLAGCGCCMLLLSQAIGMELPPCTKEANRLDMEIAAHDQKVRDLASQRLGNLGNLAPGHLHFGGW